MARTLVKTINVDSTLLQNGSTIIDWSSADIFTFDIAVNAVYTFANLPTAKTIIVIIKNGTGGALTADFPTVKWNGGSPVNNVSANTDTVFTFVKAGTDIYVTAIEEMA